MADFDSYRHLLPQVMAWLLSVESNALEHGRPLTEAEIEDARSVGVKAPENIRLLFVDQLTQPDEPELLAAATETGLLGEEANGRTVRFGIEIVHGQLSRRLLRHEFRHVYQVEMADSFEGFVVAYIQSVFADGYWGSWYERDARGVEGGG